MERQHTELAMISDPISALLEVIDILEDLGLVYAVGGSVASSVFGEPRASADADLLVAIHGKNVAEVVSRMEGGFYISEDAARDAVLRSSSFNVVHLESMYKVDLFVAGSSALDREQLDRRVHVELVSDPLRNVYVSAAENVVLRKLDWYCKGGGISDQQWRDVLGVLKVQGPAIDVPYLQRIAKDVGLEELLSRALAEAGHENR